MKSYKVYSPSYKRGNIAITHKLFNKDLFCYVVREEEHHLYKHLGIELKIIPSGMVSNIAQTRNWILDNKDSDYIVMVDDDMKSFNWLLNRIPKRLNPDEINHLIENGFRLSEESKCYLWGTNLLEDPKAYRSYNPISFSKPVLGPFIVILDTSIRYDESLPLKEDYDLFLQHMKKHRRALRFNFLNYVVDHIKLSGGCQTYRTLELEREQNQLLVKKWGSNIIKENILNENSINMLIKTGFGS